MATYVFPIVFNHRDLHYFFDSFTPVDFELARVVCVRFEFSRQLLIVAWNDWPLFEYDTDNCCWRCSHLTHMPSFWISAYIEYVHHVRACVRFVLSLLTAVWGTVCLLFLLKVTHICVVLVSTSCGHFSKSLQAPPELANRVRLHLLMYDDVCALNAL